MVPFHESESQWVFQYWRESVGFSVLEGIPPPPPPFLSIIFQLPKSIYLWNRGKSIKLGPLLITRKMVCGESVMGEGACKRRVRRVRLGSPNPAK